MEEIIQQLDKHLTTLRPEFYASLQQPLNDNEIDILEEKYKIKISHDLRALYKWKNGQNDDSFDSFVNNSMFMPLEEALETATEQTSMIGSDYDTENWWNEKWIPIFHNGGGDYICYDFGGLFTGQQGRIFESGKISSKDWSKLQKSLTIFTAEERENIVLIIRACLKDNPTATEKKYLEIIEGK